MTTDTTAQLFEPEPVYEQVGKMLGVCHWRIDKLDGKPFRWFMPVCMGGAVMGEHACTCHDFDSAPTAPEKLSVQAAVLRSLEKRVKALEKLIPQEGCGGMSFTKAQIDSYWRWLYMGEEYA